MSNFNSTIIEFKTIALLSKGPCQHAASRKHRKTENKFPGREDKFLSAGAKFFGREEKFLSAEEQTLGDLRLYRDAGLQLCSHHQRVNL